MKKKHDIIMFTITKNVFVVAMTFFGSNVLNANLLKCL